MYGTGMDSAALATLSTGAVTAGGTGQLPYTGLNVGLILLGGAGLILSGVALRLLLRRNGKARP